MIVSITSHLNPITVLIALNVLLWPEHILHGFDYIQFIIEPDGHCAVANCRTSAIHNKLIDTIEPENGEDITSFKVGLIILNEVNFTLFKSPLHIISKKIDICLLHIGGDMCTEPWQPRVCCDTADEHF